MPVYFNPTTFKAVCEDAVKAGKRAVLLLPQKQKAHDFSGKMVWQRKGIGKFLKHCWKYWKDHEAELLEQKAAVLKEQRELDEKAKKLGMMK